MRFVLVIVRHASLHPSFLCLPHFLVSHDSSHIIRSSHPLTVSWQPKLLRALELEPVEDPAFHPARQAALARLADAGNPHACYRLAMGWAFHPRSLRERSAPMEDALHLLRRAMELDVAPSLRADAAYELWLLTRRRTDLSEYSAHLLALATASGNVPARFAAHRTHPEIRRPATFETSPEYQAVQTFLVAAAFDASPMDPAHVAYCRNPGCGRWGVRARGAPASRRGTSGPSRPTFPAALPGRGRSQLPHTILLTLLPGHPLAHSPCRVRHGDGSARAWPTLIRLRE